MFVIELVVPFFFFGSKRWRRVACVAELLLQLGILVTGNYGFFNLLTMVLCLALLDNTMLPRAQKPTSRTR